MRTHLLEDFKDMTLALALTFLLFLFVVGLVTFNGLREGDIKIQEHKHSYELGEIINEH